MIANISSEAANISLAAKIGVDMFTSVLRFVQKDNVYIMEPISPLVLEINLEPRFDSRGIQLPSKYSWIVLWDIRMQFITYIVIFL